MVVRILLLAYPSSADVNQGVWMWVGVEMGGGWGYGFLFVCLFYFVLSVSFTGLCTLHAM